MNALPIDAGSINVKTGATQLTSENLADQYPENTVRKENASHQGLIKNP